MQKRKVKEMSKLVLSFIEYNYIRSASSPDKSDMSKATREPDPTLATLR
jgi:hypothetical protein